MTTYTAVKCPCGQSGCRSGNLHPVTYGQGTMQMEEATEIARKLNAYPKLLAVGERMAAALRANCASNCEAMKEYRALLTELGIFAVHVREKRT